MKLSPAQLHGPAARAILIKKLTTPTQDYIIPTGKKEGYSEKGNGRGIRREHGAFSGNSRQRQRTIADSCRTKERERKKRGGNALKNGPLT